MDFAQKICYNLTRIGGIIMDEELKERIFRILSELPTEKSYIDYKQIPYLENKKADFIADVCGFLNSIDSYKKDKFIIFGVQDKPLKRKGIKKELMDDDASYQDLCDKIQPRPIVETGIIKFEEDGYDYGYVYIPKENTDRIYSICEDYPKEEVTRFEEKTGKRAKVYASTAYIRKGSKNYKLNEYDRRNIYENDRIEKTKETNEILNYSFEEVDANEIRDILKICSLFGAWNDKNENDKKIISEVIGSDYDTWIKTIRRLLSNKSEYIEYKNHIWKIKKREELIERYAENFFDNEIEKFKNALICILKEVNPTFDLEPEKRVMANVLGKECKYSNTIKKSATEALPIVKSLQDDFVNSEEEVKKMLYNVINETLENANWKSIASLEYELPILAEANPDVFLDELEKMLKENTCEVQKLLTEKAEFVTTTKYTSGLYWALELMAWQPKYLNRVSIILTKLAQYDEEAINVMVRILLPWYPQTKANNDLRKIAVETILKENEENGWKVLKKLMPNETRNSFPTYKPKWNELIDEEVKLTNKEVYEQYKNYVEIAITYSKNNIERIKDLISILGGVSKELFEKICGKIVSKEIIELDENSKFEIWNELENFINKHKRFSDSEWSLPKEAIERLEEISLKIKPNKDEIAYKRIFNMGYWDLFSEKDDYKLQEKKLREKQINAIKKLKEQGLEKVIEFSNNVKDAFVVGICLSEIGIPLNEEKIILSLLDKNKNEILLAKGYIRNRFYKIGYEWLKGIEIEKLSNESISNFLTELPYNMQTWKLVEETLKENENKYWEKVDIRVLESEEEYNYAIERLLKYNKPIEAVELINMAIYERKNYNIELADEALNKTLKVQELIKTIDVYDIKNIIKDLQEKNYNEESLFKIEWSYLKLLDENEYKPLTIEKKIANNPTIFNDIICLVYKGKSDSENKSNSNPNLAMNAYDLLKKWTLIPGTQKDGDINENALLKWLDEAKELAIKSDRLEVALSTIGEVLFHAPADKDGFWINRAVAKILDKEEYEKMRRGYSIEAYNSVGVVMIDKEGTVWENLAEKWDGYANQTELEGYVRFANTLRDIANQYREQAKYERKHYNF